MQAPRCVFLADEENSEGVEKPPECGRNDTKVNWSFVEGSIRADSAVVREEVDGGGGGEEKEKKMDAGRNDGRVIA